MNLKNCFLVGASFLVFNAYSQDIITDRPDQTESANVVGKGAFQWETGLFVETDADFSNWVPTTNLFRYGVGEELELRLVTELSSRTNKTLDESELGINDFQIGLKYRFLEEDDVELAFLGHAILPNGSEGFSNEELGAIARMNFSHNVGENVSFGYNLGVDYLNGEDILGAYTWAAGFGLTEQLGFFAEVFGDAPEFDNLTTNADAGFTYLLNSNFQFDLSFGSGISERYNFYSGGFSWRLLE